MSSNQRIVHQGRRGKLFGGGAFVARLLSLSVWFSSPNSIGGGNRGEGGRSGEGWGEQAGLPCRALPGLIANESAFDLVGSAPLNRLRCARVIAPGEHDVIDMIGSRITSFAEETDQPRV